MKLLSLSLWKNVSLTNFFLLFRMTEKYGMKLVFKKTFADFFTENITDRDNKALISRMSALEVIQLINPVPHN